MRPTRSSCRELCWGGLGTQQYGVPPNVPIGRSVLGAALLDEADRSAVLLAQGVDQARAVLGSDLTQDMSHILQRPDVVVVGCVGWSSIDELHKPSERFGQQRQDCVRAGPLRIMPAHAIGGYGASYERTWSRSGLGVSGGRTTWPYGVWSGWLRSRA
jgi:hypothetical protein